MSTWEQLGIRYVLVLRADLATKHREREITDFESKRVKKTGKKAKQASSVRAAGECPACGAGPLIAVASRALLFVELARTKAVEAGGPDEYAAVACKACKTHLGRVMMRGDADAFLAPFAELGAGLSKLAKAGEPAPRARRKKVPKSA